MLSPWLHRIAFVPALLAVLVAAFSFAERPRPVGTTLAPDAFGGTRAKAALTELAAPGADPVAVSVQRLRAAGFAPRVTSSRDGVTVLAALHDLSGAAHVVLTRAHEGAATLLAGELVRVPAYAATILDRLGAGDAFAAGVLDGFLDGDLVAGLGRGAALSALVLGQRGDLLTATRGELEALLAGSAGRLNR